MPASAVLCNQCGYKGKLFKSASDGRLLLAPHVWCDRFLVGTYWVDGVPVDRVTSEHPGITGPVWLVKRHADRADAVPDSLTGWTYTWEADTYDYKGMSA